MNIKSYFSPVSALKFLIKKPVTVRVPYKKKEPSENYRGFHINDIEKCIGCGNCARICPPNAIEMVPMTEYPKYKDMKVEEGKRIKKIPKIDYGRCCFCALCVDVCPSFSLKLSRERIQVETDKENFVFIANDDVPYKENLGYVADEKSHLLGLKPKR